MSPELVEILAILIFGLAAFLFGERLRGQRALADERAIRIIYEARLDAILSNWGSERDLLRKAGESERQMLRGDRERVEVRLQMIQDEATKERGELITRIQAWSPTPASAEPEKPEGSHPPELREEELAEADLDKLEAEGFSPTIDGVAFQDTRSGVVWESIDEAREWRKYCKANNIPETTDPRKHLTTES